MTSVTATLWLWVIAAANIIIGGIALLIGTTQQRDSFRLEDVAQGTATAAFGVGMLQFGAFTVVILLAAELVSATIRENPNEVVYRESNNQKSTDGDRDNRLPTQSKGNEDSESESDPDDYYKRMYGID